MSEENSWDLGDNNPTAMAKLGGSGKKPSITKVQDYDSAQA